MLIELDAPVDWKHLLLDLKRWGWTLKGVAAAIIVPESTLKRWWNDGSEPGYEYGRRLVKLHGIESEKRKSAPAPGGAGLQPFRSLEPDHSEESPMARRKPQPRKPGADPAADQTQAAPGDQAGSSDVDAAIAAAQTGGTHKVSKPKPQVPASPVKGDPQRQRGAPVNMKPEMSYDQAMKKLAAGELKRSVLTEKGWVAVPRAVPAQAKV